MNRFLLFLVFLGCSLNALAQNSVKGTVKDENGEVISNVFIALKGTERSTYSDSLGFYELVLYKDSHIVTYEKSGYIIQEVKVKKKVVNVVMRGQLDGDIFKLSLEDLMGVEVSTAGKKKQMVEDIPASIVVITREDIETYGYMSIVDIISDIPGFYSLGNAFFYGGTNFGVRGFSSPGAFTNVMILVNGVNQMEDFSNGFSTDKINVPVQAIDRVEVVRGPMAVEYGSTAFMGVINIITDEIQEGGGAKNNSVSSSIGSLNTNQLFTRVAGKEGRVEYSFNGAISSSDGMDIPYSKLQSPQKLSQYGLDSMSTKGQFTVNNQYMNFKGNFKGFSFGMDYTDKDIGLPGLYPSMNSEKGFLASINSSNLMVSYLLNVSRKIDVDVKFTNSISNYKANDPQLIIPIGNVGSISFDDQYLDLTTQSKAREYEVNSYMDLAHNTKLIVGVYHRSVKKILREFDAPILQSIDRQTSLKLNQSINTSAVFSQVEYKPLKKLKVVLGARLEKTDNYNIETKNSLPDSTKVTGLSWELRELYQVEIDKVQFIPRLALLYNLNSKNVFKFMYSESKKRPSFVEIENSFASSGKGLDFSEMKAFEVNYLTNIKNGFDLNTSVYYNQLENLVVRSVIIDPVKGALQSSTNKGKAKTLGAELTIKVKPVNNLSTELSLAFQQTKDHTKGTDSLEYAFSPKFLSYVKIAYKINPNCKVGFKGRYVGGMFAEWDLLESERFGDNASAYFVFDVNTHLDLYKGVFTELMVSNVLNQDIRYASNQNSTWADKGMLGYGRRFRLIVGYKF